MYVTKQMHYNYAIRMHDHGNIYLMTTWLHMPSSDAAGQTCVLVEWPRTKRQQHKTLSTPPCQDQDEHMSVIQLANTRRQSRLRCIIHQWNFNKNNLAS